MYVIQCMYDVKGNIRYHGGKRLAHGRVTALLSAAVVFDTRDKARDVALRMPSSFNATVMPVSGKQLFTARLQGT